ncbi:maestro heat-like repeat-containing protein family member 6 isoform X2 [Oenanthe melanoleuca]|uniref:maestro heat-like repeat-containing protein family member 6 isoform X2 n=1 Tax=Oenanthe melanoleuca TaxID=2939378 RepID=UPI0024C1CB39|nr:maestro heat-like repeat-containing protein family member 6 isoform X2 [Oenanthe melanoleuca]
MAGRFLGLFKVFRGKKKKSPGVSPAQQPKELDPFHPMQDGAATDQSQEQEPTRGSFRRTLKMFRKFLRIRRRNSNTTAAKSTAKHDSRVTELQAEPHVSPDSPECSNESGTARNDDRAKADTAVTEEMAIPNVDTRETRGIANTDTAPTATLSQELILDYFKNPFVSPQQHVPAMVKSIHQSLESHVTVDARLRTDIRRLAGEHPADVVLTLLHCAPTCDRAAAKMWTAIASSGPTVEKVLPILLCVMKDWPVHSICTSDGDNKDIFALAEMPEEVDNFWRACQEQHRLPCKPNRFAVQAMKALLFCLQYEPEVMAMERKHGWDTLLCADTQHYAAGLLAREMRRVSLSLCSGIARRLLGQLSREELRWDLPFLAFLVEVLDCLDLTKCADSIIEIMSRHVQDKCRERHHLALRGLVVLSKDPSMARKMCSLSQSLLELLRDADGEVVGTILRVFTNVLQDKDILISSTTALKLAKALLELFDNDNGHVQLLSLDLFCKVMELVVDEGKKPLNSTVCQSLPPLLFHCHDENRRVAEASRETLHCAAKFLKRKNLVQLVKTEKLWQFAERLVAEDRSRAAEHLRQALPYLDSPQEPLREAAIRFIVLAGRSLRGQKEELQVISEALQALRRDDSPSQTNTGDQEIFNGRAAEPRSSAASEEPASLQDLQMPWKMRLP